MLSKLFAILALLFGISAQATEHAATRLRIIQMQAQSVGAGHTLLVGDSIIEGFWWNSICGDYVINAGVGGSGVQWWVENIDRVLAYARPKYVVVQLGVNDTRRGQDGLVPIREQAKFAERYRYILQRIKAAGAQPAILPILPLEPGKPLAEPYFDPSVLAWYNANIIVLARQMDIPWWNSWYAWARGYDALPGFTTDGVHPSGVGYAALYLQVKEAVRSAMARQGVVCK